MNVSVDHLTEKEINLIKAHRKNQKEMIIKHTITKKERYEEYKQMNLKIKDGVVRISTKIQQDKDGKHYSSCGFFHDDLTKEDVRALRDFFTMYLDGGRDGNV